MAQRSKVQMERDRAIAAYMLARGNSISQIAAYVGELRKEYDYTYSMAASDVEFVRAQWRQSVTGNFAEEVAVILAKIDELERTYWEGYQRSLDDGEEIIVSGDMEDGENPFSAAIVANMKKTVKRARRSGNVAFLQGIQWCISQRAKIIGVGNGKPLYQLLDESDDWRRQAEELGVEDPDAVIDAIVSRLLAADAEDGVMDELHESAVEEAAALLALEEEDNDERGAEKS